jgi:hypothetical protein
MLVLFISAGFSSISYATAWLSGSQFNISDVYSPGNGTCWANFTNSQTTDGYYRFYVDTNPAASPVDQARCAGVLQGYLAHDPIYLCFVLGKESSSDDFNRSSPYPPFIDNYYRDNLAYVRAQTLSPTTDYWRRIGVIFALFEGVGLGYNRSESQKPAPRPVSELDLWIHQDLGGLSDILPLLGLLSWTDLRRARCTAGIRLLPDFSDIYMTHNSWTDWRMLHTVILQYTLHVPLFTASAIIVHTRIGMVSSYDDFYVSDNGFMTFETSVMNQNTTLISNFLTPQAVPTWLRALTCQFSAVNGKDWVDTFIIENSGTYNNDYYVTDIRKLKIGERPIKDLVWLVEQTPTNTIRVKDVTAQLVRDGYIVSFNVPVWSEVYDLFNYSAVARDGDPMFEDRAHNARGIISSREMAKVHNFDDLKTFSRYNDYLNDPDSRHDPILAVAARGDLAPREPMLGALDAKCVMASEAWPRMRIHAVNSPTTSHGLPPFSFSKLPPPRNATLHDGLQDTWNYSWIVFDAHFTSRCQAYHSKNDCTGEKFCGWCGDQNVCMAGNGTGPTFGEKCQGGWTVNHVNWGVLGGWIGGVAGVIVLLGIALVVVKLTRVEVINPLRDDLNTNDHAP